MSLLGSNCLLATTLLWCSCRSSNSLLSGLLALWCCLLGNNLLRNGLLALWCCYFRSGLLALWSRFLSCSHVLLQSEWSDPSPDLFMDKRGSSWCILPALCDKYLSACREILFYFFVLSRKIFDFIFGVEICSRIQGSTSRIFVSHFLGRHEYRGRTIEMSAPGQGKFHGGRHQPIPSLPQAFLPAN